MEHTSEDKVGQGYTDENIKFTLKNSKMEEQNDKDSNALEDVPKDGVNSEKCKVTNDGGSEVMENEVVQKRNMNNQNENPQGNGQGQRCPRPQNKKQLNVGNHNSYPSTNPTAPGSPFHDIKDDWPRSFSNTSVQPKIFAGPGEVVNDTNPLIRDSNFDNLKFRIVPVTTGSEGLEYCQLVEKFGKLGSIPETSFVDGDSFVRDQQATYRKVTHDAFMNSRLATLRKTPATIVLPKRLSAEDQEKESLSSKDSGLDLVIGNIRIDEVHMGSARFDPYHSECGPDCRKCFFLTQTQNPPHLTSKIVKIAKTVDNAVSSKSQRKKFGFGFWSPSNK